MNQRVLGITFAVMLVSLITTMTMTFLSIKGIYTEISMYVMISSMVAIVVETNGVMMWYMLGNMIFGKYEKELSE